MAAPVLKSQALIDIDFGEKAGQQKYVRMSGTCDPHIQNLMIGFSQEGGATAVGYQSIPSTSDYYATSTDTSTTHNVNDTDCSDQNFDFILSLDQVRTMLGVVPGDTLDSVKVNFVYLVGVTVLGQTAPLIMPTNSDLTPTNGSPIPAKLAVTKFSPAASAGVGSCEPLYFYLKNAQGNNVVATETVTFSVSAVDTQGSATVLLYNTLSSCQAGGATQANSTVSTGNGGTLMYAKFSAAGTVFRVSIVSASLGSNTLTADNTYDITTFGTAYRWLDIVDLPTQIYKNQCFQGSLNLNMYDATRSLDTSHTASITVSLTSNDANFQFYSDSGCSSSITSFTFGTGAATGTLYVKYVATTTVKSSTTLTLTGAVASPPSGITGITAVTRNMKVSLNDNTVIAGLNWSGPQEIKGSDCNKYYVTARNSDGATIKNTGSSFAVSLTPGTSSTLGHFYSNAGCTTRLSGDLVNMANGSYFSTVYFKTTVTASTDITLSATYPASVVASLVIHAVPPAQLSSSGGAFNVATGVANLYFPAIDGNIFAVLADGSGGWYIGGNFSSVGGLTRHNLAQISAAGLVTSWNPNVDGSVNALVADNVNVYAGGAFNNVNGSTSLPALAALDRSSGIATTWNPSPDAAVNALLIQGTTLFVGGNFASIASQSRSHLASIDLTTGLANSWNPAPNGPVNVFVSDGSTLYVGGNFSAVGPDSRYSLASFTISSGLITSFFPYVSDGGGVAAPIYALALSGNTLYVGGAFALAGGQPHAHLVALDITDISAVSPTTWNPTVDGDVNKIALVSSKLYFVGSFANVLGTSHPNAAAIDLTNNTLTGWAPQFSGAVYSFDFGLNNDIFLGGGLSTIY